jgi:hypothetical protein
MLARLISCKAVDRELYSFFIAASGVSLWFVVLMIFIIYLCEGLFLSDSCY